MSKSNILTQYILTFLTDRGWEVWRNNSGKIKIGSRYVRMSPTGSGDIIGHDPFGCYVHIEVKIDDDVLSPEQIEKLHKISRTKHGIACVATSRKQFEKWFDTCRGIN